MIVGQLIGNVVRLIGVFTEVALNGPFSAILLLVGGAITLFSMSLLGYLVAGALFEALIGATFVNNGRSPPPRAK